MASNDTASGSVPGRLVASLREAVKERFIGLLTSLRPAKAQLLEDEQEVYLQVGRTVWHAPRQLRVELWLSSLTRRSTLVSDYQAYVSQEIAREASCDIDKDVQRTFPSTRRFHSEEGQTQLRNVLRAYAAYDPEVAYCQGMNFIAGLLLLYMPSEGHAFAALVLLMEDRGLRSFYHRSLSLLQVQLWQLSRLVSPRLNQHLEACGVVPMLYGASWLMTAFSADFPIPFSARIMDVLLADQCECALLKVAVAIMKTVETRLLDMHDLEDVLSHLKIEVPAWEEEELHAVLNTAFTKPWTPRQLSILSTTEGVETVAQAMDRVMGGPAGQQNGEDEDGGDDGCPDAEARVTTVTIPRLDPPPSFSASPACGTPILPGPFGTGSGGGAAVAPSGNGIGGGAVVGSGGSPPAMGMAPYGKCGSHGSGSSGGGGMLLGSGSPATWSIPSVHPNVTASPALSAFRRAHLPCFQPSSHLDKAGAPGHPPVSTRSLIRSVSAAASATVSGNTSYMSLGPDGPHPLCASGASSAGPSAFAVHQHQQHWRSSGTGGASGCLSPDGSAHGDSSWRISDARGQGLGEHAGEEEDSGEEWGDFSGSMARQYRVASRSTPGTMNRRASHGMPLPGDTDGVNGQAHAQGQGAHAGAMHSCFSAAPSFGGQQPSPPHSPRARSGPVRLSAAQFWEDGGSEGRRGPGVGAGGPSRLSQPIPVPWSHQPLSGRASHNSVNGGSCSGVGSTTGSGGGGGPAAAAAAVACGKPPLPPRSAFSDRAAAVAALGPYSRLSVVAEDPISIQVGPVAPAPSPRGSMDMQAMGCGGAAAGSAGGGYGYGYAHGGYGSASGEGGYNHYGGVLLTQYSGGGTGPFGGGSGGSTAAYGNSGTIDCGTGSGSGATGNALVSPSGVSGVVSPHALLSPRVGVSGTSVWYPGPAGGPRMTDGYDHGRDDDRADGEGGDDDDAGYVPLDETGPGLCLERAASGLDRALLYDSAVPLPGSATAPPPPYYRGSSFTSAVAPLLSAPLPAPPPAPPPAAPANTAVGSTAGAPPSAADTATDIAGDILRMLTAVDAGNANAAYDPRTLLGESMYADSPNREAHTLVRNDSQRLRHLPSSSALAEMAAQDLAKAQEEAERVRQELQAQLQHQQQQQQQQQQGSTASLDRSNSVGIAAGDVVSAALAAPEGPGHELGICGAEPVAPPGGGEQAAGAAEQSDSDFVLKRPTLYVDGIPMFDPKSLMADRGEAKPMFTPLVSPNAGGYADQLATLTTPTGTSGAPTPAGGEHPFKDTQQPAAGADVQGETAAAAADDAEDPITTITITADSTVTTGAAAAASGSARLSEGGAADSSAAAASVGGEELSDATAATAAAADSDSAAAVAEAPTATGAQEAFEVDWSQAPPVPPPPPPLSTSPLRPSGGSGEAGAAPPVTPRGSASSAPQLFRGSPPAAAGGGLDGAVSSDAAGAGWLATVAAAAAAATADLIDMQAPAAAAASAEAPRGGAAAAVTAALAHRNGLSLIVPPIATTHSPFTSPHSPPAPNYGILSAESAALVAASAAAASAVPAAAAAAAAAGSCLATLPYGLLPASSTVSVSAAPLVPSMASCRSMNVHLAAGNSFSSTRSHPTEAQWMALHTDSAAPSEAGSRPVSRRWKDLPCDDAAAGEAATTSHAAAMSRFFESRSYRGMASFQPGTGTVTEEDETAVDSPQASIAAAPGTATQGEDAPLERLAPAHTRPHPPRLVLPEELRHASRAAPCSPTPPPAAACAPNVPPTSISTTAPAVPSVGPSTPVVASVPAALSITSLEPADSAASASAVSAAPLSGASSAMADPFAGPAVQLDPAATPEPNSLGPASGGRAEVEAEGSGQLDVDSADSRALSPSLAHHIMSAYLLSTAHQQQQEQLELEQQQQQQRQPSAVGSAELVPELSLACGSHGGGLPAAPGSSGLPEVSSLSHGLVVPPPPTATSNGAASTTTASHTNAPGQDLTVNASPTLGSPTTAPPVSLAAATATATATACKPATPFAVRLEDPATCRLSAELLCALPPPSLLQPAAPASPMQPSSCAGGLPSAACNRPAGGGGTLSGGGASGGVGDSLLVARTSGVMPALGSGEVVFTTAAAAAGHGVSSCPSAGGAASGSHYPLTGYRSQEAADSGGGGHASALAALTASTHSFRVPCSSGGGASNGGACPLPLLRPPPAPAVPLSHTLGGAAAHTEQPAAAPAASCPSAAASALLQPSGSPSLCPVEASSISVPVLAPAPPPALQAPDWTATFDESAAATATCNGVSSLAAGKQLGAGTGACMGVGVRTPEASMRLLDLHVSPRASGDTHDASDRPAAMFVVEGMGGAPHGA